MSLPSYTEADILRWFGARDLIKAKTYIRSVTRLSAEPPVLSAFVLGSAPKPYQVKIRFSSNLAGNIVLSPHCTCPVQWHCKHTAATLLAWLQQNKQPTKINPDVLTWLEEFRRTLADARPAKPAKAPPRRDTLLYCLTPRADGSLRVTFFKARLDDHGRPLKLDDWNNVERAITNPPSFVSEDDLTILPLLWGQRDRHAYIDSFPLTGDKGELVLQRMLASGRLFYAGETLQPLAAAPTRPAILQWPVDSNQRVRAELFATPPADRVLTLKQTWYVDGTRGELGLLDVPYSPAQLAHLFALPPLSALDVPLVSGALAELAPQLPRPQTTSSLRVIDAAPQPRLTLGTLASYGMSRYRDYGHTYFTVLFDFATLQFQYDSFSFMADDPAEFVTTPAGEALRVKRDTAREAACIKLLDVLGFKPVPPRTLDKTPKHLLGLASESAWPGLIATGLAALRADGWTVEVPRNFRHYMLEVDAWEADFEDDGSGWLSLNLGVVLEGQRLPLAPLLYDLFQHDARWLDAAKLARIRDAEMITLHTPEGVRFTAPAGRLKPLAGTLIDLFDTRPQGALKVSRLDAPRLADLADNPQWQNTGGDAVIQFARQLQQHGGIKAVKPPKGLGLELRPYQREGLAWLQYLREHNLAGILADDMGLGKTAQTLAHLLLEKQSGRLDRPALVVLPTSLIFNWKREAERFAPALKVLSLHGKDRVKRFSEIAQHDIVLTTYPLLWRDHAALAETDWHVLILDEAQTVKNAGSRAAKIVRDIHARHRLCLTGTPLENHLGELWAQFDFLLPGFMGDSKQFTRTFRTPIEKHGDTIRAGILAKRIAPFILRRRKQDVAKELPPKTIIVRTAEIVGGQRDLYETVRSAMDAKVLEAIAQKGFARSQIVILDALLKLRQVCCDPRLLKSAGAQKVKERAKLDLLMDILPELLDEGRKVLLFSQFTSMLALIELELAARKIKYVILTGSTTDRESVIRSFQEGEVPVFLISLKAGGVGLNLTAADTIIHYDPWWNPAVENQATDRAHRIGQTKHVFVYKLVVAGSIEEKILALQEKKAELAASVLSEDSAALAKFGEADIRALLAPLPSADQVPS
ncbi:MAG: DEAD/DEAH box helicase [Thiobacillus sp.]|nr:DEAD/DEAH box helicase [Thiobacillus sp.]